MTPNEARKAIYARFTTLFRDDLSQPILKIYYENDFPGPDAPDEYVEIKVQHEGREQITLGKKGGRRFRSSGFVLAEISTEVGDRMKKADSIAKVISDIFDAVSFEGLDFQAPMSREGGRVGKRNRVIVEAPFSYEERK